MKIKLATILCVFLVNLIYALTPSDNYKLNGTVIDLMTNKPLANVSVSIHTRNTNTVIKAQSTDEKGEFEFKDIPESIVRVKFSLVGYRGEVIDSVSLKSTSRLGLIRLESTSIEMPEVVIKSLKPMIELHADKQVLNVDRMPGSASSVTEVLKNSGLVDVDPATNAVSVRGQSVKIQMDGHEYNMPGEMLTQMPATMLDQVEIILAPGAKESAEGGTYIINLITKKNKVDNYSGSISYTGMTNRRNYGGLSLNYKANKLNLFSQVYGGYYEFLYTNENQRYVYNSPNMYYQYSNGKTNYYGSYLYGKVGLDYDFDENNTMTMYVSFDGYNYNNSTTGDNIVKNSNDVLQYAYTQNNSGENPEKDFSVYGFYKRKFEKKGNELTLGALYTNIFEDDNGTLNFDYSYRPSMPQLQNSRTHTNAKTLILKADYVLPFTEDRLEAGYNFTYRSRKNDYDVKDFSYLNLDWRDSLGLSNIFDYNENINALYLTYSYKLSDLEIKLGIRSENLNTEGNQITQALNFHENYLSLFPNLNVSYKINDLFQLGFNAFRRVTYPQMYYVNPFRQYTGPNTFFAGNPKLEPSYTSSFAVNLSQYINAYYTKSTGIFTSAMATENDTILVSSYVNLNQSETYGFGLTLPYYNSPMSPVHLPAFITMMNISLNYIYNKQSGQYISEDLSMINKSYTFRANLGFKIWWDINFNIFGYYMPKTENKLVKRSEYKYLQIYLSKTFLDNKLRVYIVGSDLLYTSKMNSQSFGSNYYSDYTYSPQNTRGIGISISYMLNQFKERQDTSMDDGRDASNRNGVQ